MLIPFPKEHAGFKEALVLVEYEVFFTVNTVAYIAIIFFPKKNLKS